MERRDRDAAITNQTSSYRSHHQSNIIIPNSYPHIKDAALNQTRAPRRQDTRNLRVRDEVPSRVVDQSDLPESLQPVPTQPLIRLDERPARAGHVVDVQRELQSDPHYRQIPRGVEHRRDPPHRVQAHYAEIELCEPPLRLQRIPQV